MGEKIPGQKSCTEKIPPCTGRNQSQPIFHRANSPRAAALSVAMISIADHISKSDADKDASREQIRQVENALYMRFQAHQVRIYPA
jgi:hypothetical protein